MNKVNGFIVGNPYDIMAKKIADSDVIWMPMTFGAHWDVPVKFINNRLEVAANSMGDIFKEAVEHFASRFDAKYDLYIYVCEDDGRYVRFEVFSSNEAMIVAMDAFIERLSQAWAVRCGINSTME